MITPGTGSPVAVSLRGAGVRFGERTVWSGLDLDVAPGEFLAVLGPNGAGKSTLVRVLLGEVPLSEGTVLVGGAHPGGRSTLVGYIPQQRGTPADMPVTGRDLVAFGVDGHRWGIRRGRRGLVARVDAALDEVGAETLADVPVGLLSGGEQQRLRVAQALVADPPLLLCDEPLLSLDLGHQRAVTALIDQRRREAATAVVFVTHDVNPVIDYVDRALYLVGGRWAAGAPEEILTSEVLSDLYGSEVDVLRVRNRLVVLAGHGDEHGHDGHHGDEHGRRPERHRAARR